MKSYAIYHEMLCTGLNGFCVTPRPHLHAASADRRVNKGKYLEPRLPNSIHHLHPTRQTAIAANQPGLFKQNGFMAVDKNSLLENEL